MSQLKDSQHLKIPFKTIKEATENFKASNCIGKGGYGQVYKGKLLISGQLTPVAVKQLDEKLGQGSKEFLTEIDLLRGQRHPNLISLLGYCEEGKEKIIVYEYAERGSLDQYIKHNKSYKTTYSLTWLERLKICLDIARGLDHLHNHVGKHQSVIHRDIKSSNILLDRNWVAKVSDLGLSKLSLAGLDRSAVISFACGTACYIEPEYMVTGIVKKESDIYSFGMVLLEVLTGRLCYIIDDDHLLLLEYYKRNKLLMIIDRVLKQQMSSDAFSRFLNIVSRCLHEDRKQRYPMDRVVKELEEVLKIETSLINEDGKKSLMISSNDLQDWRPISEFSFVTLITRRTNVGKIFDIFDLNKDGGLNRKEVAALLFVTKHDEDKLSGCIDEVFSLYDKYTDGKKGLTYHGLLQYYDDGHSDLGSDIVPVTSDSDGSRRRKKMLWIFQKFNEEIGGDKKTDFDGTSDHLEIDPKVLGFVLEPENDDESATWVSSLETSRVTTKPVTIRAMLLYILSMLSISMVLVKLKYMWFLLVIFINSKGVFGMKEWKRMI